MTRNGTGNAWKHRQTRKHGLSGIPRELNPRKLKSPAQFTLDQLYISPFSKRRKYDEDGRVSYVEMERNLTPTGFRIFDDYVVYLSRGASNLRAFADRHGLRLTDIDSMVFLLTGMRGVDFRMAIQVRIADDLLRYTDLQLGDVARRAGFGTAYNLYLTYKRECNVAPGLRRCRLQKKGDVGRFVL